MESSGKSSTADGWECSLPQILMRGILWRSLERDTDSNKGV